MILAHAPLGLIVAEISKPIWDKKQFSKKQTISLYLLTIFGSVFPDSDMLIAIYIGISHRELLTHTIFPYLLLGFIGFLINNLPFNKKRNSKWLSRGYINSFLFCFLIGIASHFITDTFYAYIYPFLPFSDQSICIGQLAPIIETDNYMINYFTTPLALLIETTIIVSASIFYFIRIKKFDKSRIIGVFTISFFTIAIITTILLFIL